MQFFKPVIIFILVWVFVFILYSFRLSYLLNQNISLGAYFFPITFFCFTLGYLVAFLFKQKVYNKIPDFSEFDLAKVEKNVFLYFKIWAAITLVEIAYSRGIPILWIIQGSSKTYFDFGIPTLHGFLNALQISLGIISFYLYLRTKNKKTLYISLFLFAWQIAVISRQLLVTQLIEIFYLYLVLSKSPMRVVKNLATFGLGFIVLFGVVGDLRTGKDHFYALALPSDNWIDWLPSGFLWVYIYLVTPLNNLLYNFSSGAIIHPDYTFSNTTTLLFPSIIRKLIYGESYSVSNTSGNLISEAFNVSSAFTSPFLDAGYAGIAIFSFVIGFISFICWWTRGNKRVFYRAVIAQCLILTIFYNHFFYLPIIFQLFWIFLIV